MEQELTQDNDTWQPLSLATRRLLQSHEQKNEQTESEPARSDGDEEKRKAHREYIEHRLCDFASFERRATGVNRVRRKRN